MDINTKQLLKNNLRVVAVGKDKRALGKWKHYRDAQTPEQLRAEVNKTGNFAVICTDGLECIDIDAKFDYSDTLIDELIKALIFGIDGIEEYLLPTHTPNHGMHLIYRCKEIKEGNQKLASRYVVPEDNPTSEHDKTRCLIETRGEGGYFIFPPSMGYSFDNENTGIDNFVVHEITLKQRNQIIEICKTFNEVAKETINKSKKPKIDTKVKGSNKTVIDDFNSRVYVSDLIESLGFTYYQTRGDFDHYTRPGKKSGVSAAVIKDKNKVYNFSGNSPCMDQETTYDSFALYAAINHNGDYSAAAKDLYKQGYGDRIQSIQEQNKQDIALITSDSKDKDKAVNNEKLEQIYLNSRITLENKPPDIEYIIFIKDNYDIVYPIASYGDFITLTGFAGTGKTTFINEIIKSNITHTYCLDDKILLKTHGNIIHLDTEQSEQDCYIDFQKVMNSVGIKKTPSFYFKFSIGGYTVKERLAFVEYVINRVGDVGIFILDGIVDMCTNFNDLEISQALMEHIRQLGIKKKFITFSILHLAKSTGKARGHLGSISEEKSKAMFETVKEKDESGFTGRYLIKHIKQRGGKSIDQIGYEFDGNGNIISEKF